MSIEWLRWYHGAISDPKWPIVARKSKQPVAIVVALWAALLEHASQAEPRGSVGTFDCETIDAQFGIDDGVSAAVFNAMVERNLIVDGCIANWSKRQPKRERCDDSAQRVQEQRARKAVQKHGDSGFVTPSNASDEPCNASVTPSNAQIRVEENRVEEKEESPPTPRGGVDGGESSSDPLGDDSSELPDIEMEQFLEAYPAHAQTTPFAVLPAWKKMRSNRHYPGLPRLFDALGKWEASEQWRKDGGRFIPSPQKFIADRYWTREPPPEVDPYTALTGGKTFAELNAPAMAASGARYAHRKHEPSDF